MEKVVADASVIVKWFVDEIYSENARKLRDEFINGRVEIHSPDLMPYEVINALKYTGLFSRDEIILIARSVALYGFNIIALSRKLAERIAEIAMDRNVTVYDAAYVAVAEELNAELLTADEKLIERIDMDFVRHVKDF